MIGNVVAGSNDIGYLHPAPWNVKYLVEDVTVGEVHGSHDDIFVLAGF